MAEKGIKDKVAVVTGGADGIGLAIVEDLLQENAKAVIIIDVNENAGTEAALELNKKYGAERAEFIKADVTKDLDSAFEEIIAKYKTVDILVNNAGVADENFKRTLNINTVAPVEWSMKFLEAMRKDKGGKGGTIVNIASMYGFIIDPYLVYYKTSKFAIMGFSQSLGHVENYNVTGVRVLTICPGYVRTKLTQNIEVTEALSFQKESYKKNYDAIDWLDTADVSRATVDVLKSAESGSAWMVKKGEELRKIPLQTL